MTRVGELVLARNQILQFTNSVDDSNFISTAQRLNLITTELQESVMKTRMQPIGNVWAKFPRVVRDLSSQLGKQVRIDMEGQRDRAGQDDHRSDQGSARRTWSAIRWTTASNRRKCAVARRQAGRRQSDVAGVPRRRQGQHRDLRRRGRHRTSTEFAEKAVEKGLVSADQAARMTDREAAQLIFLPGFSTAEQVTQRLRPRRGHGRRQDEHRKNRRHAWTSADQPGQGTTVKIKIPLTLAIIPALVVTCGGDRYAIPQVSLLELVRLEGEQARKKIEQIHGAPVYRLRGKLLPIVYLRDELRLENNRQRRATKTCSTSSSYGLTIGNSAWSSMRSTTPRKLSSSRSSKQLKGIDAYAGTTIMGDGKVALILDVLGAAQKAHVVTEHRDRGRADHAETSGQQGKDRQSMLLLAVGDRQIAMPISLVARLEEIPRNTVEKSDHHEVVQYRGHIMPLVRLSELLEIPVQEDLSQPLQVVVYTEGERSLGFVVDRVADIASAEITVTHDCDSDELLASTVIQQKVTDLLNLPSIIRRVDPKFFGLKWLTNNWPSKGHGDERDKAILHFFAGRAVLRRRSAASSGSDSVSGVDSRTACVAGGEWANQPERANRHRDRHATSIRLARSL